MKCVNISPVSKLGRVIFGLGLFSLCEVASATQLDMRESAELSSAKGLIHLSIDKVDLKAQLEFLPSLAYPSQVVRQFQIAIGRGTGDKTKEGDLKTPEGIYFTQAQLSTRHLNPKKYGPLAIPLNFPNPLDKLLGKTGSGIWLHGAGDDTRMNKKQVTEGCVAFFNSDIVELAPLVIPDSTIVSITTDHRLVNRREDRNEVAQATENWIKNWQTRDLDAYVEHYSERFRFRGRSRQGFKKYKSLVFQSYKVMQVKMTDVRIVSHPKYAVSIMNQDFVGDKRYFAKGRKVLYWVRETGGWRILQEDFNRRRNYHLLSVKEVFKQPGRAVATSRGGCGKKDSCG